MITLYGSGQSRSFRALWALEESGLDYRYNAVAIGSPEKGGTQTESYRSLNYQGKVPSLEHDGTVVNESAAILNYIAALSPSKNLMPLNDLRLRAYYDELCFFVLAELEQALWTNAKHKFVLPKEYRTRGIIDTTHWEFSKSLNALIHYLNESKFAINDHFTMADILISHTLQWAEGSKFKIQQSLLDYKNRMYQRPACKRAIETLHN